MEALALLSIFSILLRRNSLCGLWQVSSGKECGVAIVSGPLAIVGREGSIRQSVPSSG